jgi:hypothetical protein
VAGLNWNENYPNNSISFRLEFIFSRSFFLCVYYIYMYFLFMFLIPFPRLLPYLPGKVKQRAHTRARIDPPPIGELHFGEEALQLRHEGERVHATHARGGGCRQIYQSNETRHMEINTKDVNWGKSVLIR